ncbi:MAG: rhomboid family intramembrane serine protease [Opitutales bacterium]
MRSIRVTYNAPFVLSLALLALAMMAATTLTAGNARDLLFVLPGSFDFKDPLDYVRLFTHVLGHADWSHFTANFTVILLIGPILEEKYGTGPLILIACLTAAASGALHVLLFSSGLTGASAIAFMMILLGSLVNMRKGTLPATFIVVVVLYLGHEIIAIFKDDDISQFAHIMGGLCGAAFGYWWSQGQGASA